MRTRTGRGASAIAVAVVAVLIATCSGPVSTSPSPSASLAPNTPSASTPLGSPAAVGPIAEAKYLSEPNDVPAIVARIKADTKLTASERAEWVRNYSDRPATQVVGLEFSAGNFTETATEANGNEVGARGRYAVADGKTLVLSGIGTFAITPISQGFALKMIKLELPGEVELLVASILFESSPFTLESPAPQAIPEGIYVGKTIPTADVIGLITADKKLTAAEKTGLIDKTLELRGTKTFAPTLELHAGKFAQGQQLDGGPTNVGSRGTYAFPDAMTLVEQEQGINTFRVTWAEGEFSLKLVGTPANESDALIYRFLFESSFAMVP
jgi:hypothetical protein